MADSRSSMVCNASFLEIGRARASARHGIEQYSRAYRQLGQLRRAAKASSVIGFQHSPPMSQKPCPFRAHDDKIEANLAPIWHAATPTRGSLVSALRFSSPNVRREQATTPRYSACCLAARRVRKPMPGEAAWRSYQSGGINLVSRNNIASRERCSLLSLAVRRAPYRARAISRAK